MPVVVARPPPLVRFPTTFKVRRAPHSRVHPRAPPDSPSRLQPTSTTGYARLDHLPQSSSTQASASCLKPPSLPSSQLLGDTQAPTPERIESRTNLELVLTDVHHHARVTRRRPCRHTAAPAATDPDLIPLPRPPVYSAPSLEPFGLASTPFCLPSRMLHTHGGQPDQSPSWFPHRAPSFPDTDPSFSHPLGAEQAKDQDDRGRGKLGPPLSLPKNRSTGNLALQPDAPIDRSRYRMSFEAPSPTPIDYESMSRYVLCPFWFIAML